MIQISSPLLLDFPTRYKLSIVLDIHLGKASTITVHEEYRPRNERYSFRIIVRRKIRIRANTMMVEVKFYLSRVLVLVGEFRASPWNFDGPHADTPAHYPRHVTNPISAPRV